MDDAKNFPPLPCLAVPEPGGPYRVKRSHNGSQSLNEREFYK